MFKFRYIIQKDDINYGGHVGNERALLFFQMARMEFFKSLNLSELNIGDGTGVIQKNCFVEYHKQLFIDDEISIEISNIELFKTNFNVEYKIFNKENKIVISGSTLLVCFDYSKQKIKKIPNSFKEKLIEIEEGV